MCSSANSGINQIESLQGMPQLQHRAFAIEHLEIFVYVKSSGTSITMPALPGVQIVVVHPVGVHPISLASLSGYFTIVVWVIFKLQDFLLLDQVRKFLLL
jgi:hypothetical protein